MMSEFIASTRRFPEACAVHRKGRPHYGIFFYTNLSVLGYLPPVWYDNIIAVRKARNGLLRSGQQADYRARSSGRKADCWKVRAPRKPGFHGKSFLSAPRKIFLHCRAGKIRKQVDQSRLAASVRRPAVMILRNITERCPHILRRNFSLIFVEVCNS